MPPGNPPAPAKVTSLTDPTAAWTNKGQRKVGFAYGANYLIDLQQAIIVDVEATPARWSAEVAATKTVLERTRECFGLNPQRLAADAAYGSGLMIGWLTRRRIEPHIPLLDREHQTKGFLTRAEFTFDPQANLSSVPAASSSKAPGWSATTAPYPILRAPRIAAPALSSPAVPREPSGLSPATCSRPNGLCCKAFGALRWKARVRGTGPCRTSRGATLRARSCSGRCVGIAATASAIAISSR
jgi:hypothetical protein